MKTIIIDDEDKARKSIQEILKLAREPLDVVDEADSVKTAYQAILKSNPDLILLDINLTDGTGFDLLKMFPKIQFKVIFITAYEDFAIKAFQFSAIDYILKPIDPIKLLSAIQRASESLDKEALNNKLDAMFSNIGVQNNSNRKLVLSTDHKIHVVETKDIIHCESDGGYTTFKLINNKTIIVSKNLKLYEDLLSPLNFFRTHKSHLINLNYIDYFNKKDGGFVVMKNGLQIPLAQRKREQFLQKLTSI